MASLRAIVEYLCESSGLTAAQIDLSMLDDETVTGYLIDRPMPARQAIEHLQIIYDFDVEPRAERLAFRTRRDLAAIDTITERQTLDGVLVERAQEDEIPRIVTLTYIDAAQVPEPGLVTAQRAILASHRTVHSRLRADLKFLLVMESAAARQVADRVLFSAWAERDRIHIHVPLRWLSLSPTDRVLVQDAQGRVHLCRIEQQEIGADLTSTFTLRSTTPIQIPQIGTAAHPGSPRTDGPADGTLVMLSLPALRDADVRSVSLDALWRPYAALVQLGGVLWSQWLIESSTNEIQWEIRATGGRTVHPVGWLTAAPENPASYNRTDRDGYIDIQLDPRQVDAVSARVMTVSDDDFIQDRARIAILKRSGGRSGEVGIIAYRDVQDRGGGVVRLSHLIRGQRGTETMDRDYAPLDFVVFIDGAGLPYVEGGAPTEEAERYYRARLSATRTGVVDHVHEPWMLSPYAPVHIALALGADSSMTVSWVRRTRTGGALVDGTGEVSLGETSERYDVEIYADADVSTLQTLLSASALTEPRWIISAAQVASSGITGYDEVDVFIYQRSAVVGRGHPGRARLSTGTVFVPPPDPTDPTDPDPQQPGAANGVRVNAFPQLLVVPRGGAHNADGRMFVLQVNQFLPEPGVWSGPVTGPQIFGQVGLLPGSVNYPDDLCFAADYATLYVVDYPGNTPPVDLWAGSPANPSGFSRLATYAAGVYVRGIHIVPSGTMYLAGGTTTTPHLLWTADPSAPTTLTLVGRFIDPSVGEAGVVRGLAADSSGRLYIGIRRSSGAQTVYSVDPADLEADLATAESIGDLPSGLGSLAGIGIYDDILYIVDESDDSLWRVVLEPVDPTAPRAPASITATPGDTQVTLAWTAGGTGGSPITSWQYRQDSGTWTDIPGSDGTTTSYTVTSLMNDTIYTFEVRAVNAIGEGTASASVSATPFIATAPGAPTGLAATAGDTQVALAWTAPADDGGSMLTGYDVQYRTSPAGTWMDATHTGTDPSATVSGLTNGTTYDFQVRAVNAIGNSAWSATASASPASASLPGAPTGLAATAGNAEVTLAWMAGPSGGSPITSYELQQDAGTWTTIPGSGAGTTSYTVMSLTNDQAYSFAVRAVNAVGAGPASATVTATPADAGTPDRPTDLVTGARDAQVLVSWVAGSDGGSAITGYEYQLDGGAWTTISGSGAGTVWTSITGLMNGTEYTIRIRAVNANGGGAASDAVTVTPATSIALTNQGTFPSGLFFAWPAAVDSAGTLFVGDRETGLGSELWSGDPATPSGFTLVGDFVSGINWCHGMAFDVAGALYVVNRTSSGARELWTGAADAPGAFTKVGDFPASANIYDIAFGTDDTLYAISDSFADMVIYSLDKADPTTLTELVNFTGRNVMRGVKRGLAFDSAGDLAVLISDSARAIWSAPLTSLTTWTQRATYPSAVTQPRGMAISSADAFYLSTGSQPSGLYGGS